MIRIKLLRQINLISTGGVGKSVAACSKLLTEDGELLTSMRMRSHNCLGSQRHYSVTKRIENPLIVGGLGLLVAAVSAQYALSAYQQYKIASAAKASNPDSDSASKTGGQQSASTGGFSFTSTWFAKNFYDGGFEDKMTRREAALILGVRESASADRIKEAHRRVLSINHPDKGGSAYLAAKINESKDFLLKGK